MIRALDHVAVPMEAVDEMLEFYSGLGFIINDEYPGLLYSVCFGDNKINFHTPDLWKADGFNLRGHSALPGCGDFCFVWDGSGESLHSLLSQLGATVEDGPVERSGGRSGGVVGTSVYIRDPDANLLEFIIYG